MNSIIAKLDFGDDNFSECEKMERLYYLAERYLSWQDREKWAMMSVAQSSLHYEYTYEELKEQYIRLMQDKGSLMNKEIDQEVTPEFLNALYEQKKTTLDKELVEGVKQQMIKAAKCGKKSTRVVFEAESSWELVVDYFKNLGFCVENYGCDYEEEYDEDGNLVYIFDIGWREDV